MFQVEARLRQLEGKALAAKPATPASKGKPNIEKYDKDRKGETPGLLSAAKVCHVSFCVC